jgi:hypothetical protein
LDLWLHPSGGGYQLGVVMVSAAGNVKRAIVPVPEGPEIGIDLGLFDGDAVLTLTTPGGEIYHRVAAPLGFSMDRTRHRFGHLEGPGQDAMVVDDLRVARSSMDLSRQVVVVDDFDGPEWAGVWTSPEVGAVKLAPASDLKPGRADGGVLIVSLDQAGLLGPDYLERSLEVPRVAMTCVFDLDLSSLLGLDSGVGGATVLAFRDQSRQDPTAGNLARLQVRRNGGNREVRLVGIEATPWIPLPEHEATLEVQWQRTAADESRLDLWIDGCGPDDDACASGWEVTGAGPAGLVTAVRLGALEAASGAGGVVRFDDVACAGDSWVEPE